MQRNLSLWDDQRLTLQDSIDLTVTSLKAYGEKYDHWAIAFSGGKDSTAVTTLVATLIEQGRLLRPKSLVVEYVDTRMELPPLQAAALSVLDTLEQRGVRTQVVVPPLDDRFFVYILGRGVPPPKNNFRWCTAQLKIEPMLAALRQERERSGEKMLMLTGVRIGESAARDARIAVSCSKDGAECGQGWYQQSTPESVADTLAPLLHWRVCHVWDWLTFDAPRFGFATESIAEVYGGDEAEEINARTGCIQCPLASKDTALENLLDRENWAYLAPLTQLRPLYEELRLPRHRLRQDGSQRRKDGSVPKNPMRMGPLTLEARLSALERVLDVQGRINVAALALGRPGVDLINAEEEARIRELIEARTWPQGWTGNELPAELLVPEVVADGVTQALLLGDGL